MLANGTTVKVKDSAGAEQLAGLFHVQEPDHSNQGTAAVMQPSL
jgi:hypothetical protein